MSFLTDVVLDLQYGDCGKGKISHYLAHRYPYTHSLRFNGGPNAGHTIYHKGKKFVTHHIPSGIFFGIKSIIGPGCVLNPKTFLEEIRMLEENGIKTKGKIFVARNTHIITETHLKEEKGEESIGTTRTGNGPAYRDKYMRIGTRACDVPELESYLIDLYSELYGTNKDIKVLCEGAQGFGLDIDWGDYPFVTSSHTTLGSVIVNGIPHGSIRNVWGIAKMYETYVGNKRFEGDDPIFEKIRQAGSEFGATTGRPRQVNWVDLELLKRAIRLNSVTHVVFNKADILDAIGVWKLRKDIMLVEFKSSESMQEYLISELKLLGINPKNIYFSRSPNTL